MNAIEKLFPVVEAFRSVQGEGLNTGREAIFIRLGKCNLKCPWCDTDFNTYTEMSYEQIFSSIDTKGIENVILTGGEPTIHKNLGILIVKLKESGYKVWIETNGLVNIPESVDYIATSPKRLYQNLYQKDCIKEADEVRIVIDSVDCFEFCEFIESKIFAKRYYVSPCEIEGKINWKDVIEILGRLNERLEKKVDWLLSIQIHKLMDIR